MQYTVCPSENIQNVRSENILKKGLPSLVQSVLAALLLNLGLEHPSHPKPNPSIGFGELSLAL
jgi:hypothetical protein